MKNYKLNDRLYIETEGKAPFDWFKVLQHKIDTDDYASDFGLETLAGSWVTCACGNQCARIPRRTENNHALGEPIDFNLSYLGIEFMNMVINTNWKQAIEILKTIEIRASKILKEMDANSK